MRYDDLQVAAQLGVPVLITAESSRERECCAWLIHANSARSDGAFVTFRSHGVPGVETAPNVPPAGHSAGEDDGALRHRFDLARSGTLFIGDIVMLAAAEQAEILSLLDEEHDPRQCEAMTHAANRSVRIIAGASRPIDAERAAGAFCETLFYRLNVIHIDLTTPDGRSGVAMNAGETLSSGRRDDPSA